MTLDLKLVDLVFRMIKQDLVLQKINAKVQFLLVLDRNQTQRSLLMEVMSEYFLNQASYFLK